VNADAATVRSFDAAAPVTPQLRTLLLTDLCDSTTLVERLGDAAAATLFRAHDALVLELQQRWRGRLIDRSDGLLLLFERPIDGLGFALDYTRGLRTLGEAHKVPLQARAGLHVGEVLTWRNSDAAVAVGAKPLEVEGLAKPMAGRLMTLARPGQLLLSAVAEPLARRAARELGERGEHLLWKSWGRWRFKGVPEAQDLYEVGEPGYAPLRAPKAGAKAWRDIPLWRRPASLAAEALVLLGLATGAWFATRPEPAIAFNERDWVVVADLRNLTGDQLLDDSLEQAFRISLEQSRYVNVLSDLKARDTLALMQRRPGTALDRAVASEIALRDGARAVILPTVAEVGGKVRVSAEVIDPRTQTTVYAESADGTGAASALGSIDHVTAALRGKLGEALESIGKTSEPLPQVSTGNLDALRAYALGQKAYGRSDYRGAQAFYLQAVAIDPQFALAHLGIVRTFNALDDLASGLPYLKRAQALQDRLPARERLYLQAWTAQIEAPERALAAWSRLAALYPDFFPAQVNTAYRLAVLNRFQEGVRFAKRGASPHYEFSPLPWELAGELLLATGRYGEAKQAFQRAVDGGVGVAAMRSALVDAAERRFDDAAKAWPDAFRDNPEFFDRVSLLLDQGRMAEAVQLAADLQARLKTGSPRSRQALYPLAVAQWLAGETGSARRTLARLVDDSLRSARTAPSRAEAFRETSTALHAAILMQRLDPDVARATAIGQTLHSDPAFQSYTQLPTMRALMQVLAAQGQLAKGDAAGAIARLEPLLDDTEPFETHSVLADAYARLGDHAGALRQAEWLRSHRGRAYAEMGCEWCQQPMNVVDTNLAWLMSAEHLQALGSARECSKALAEFKGRWPDVPGYFRPRVEAISASKLIGCIARPAVSIDRNVSRDRMIASLEAMR
jgi:putative peptide modification system cyclase